MLNPALFSSVAVSHSKRTCPLAAVAINEVSSTGTGVVTSAKLL